MARAADNDFEIRDSRKQPFFWVAHDFLHTHARKLGPIPALVYMALCHHANKDQECRTSATILAKELDISGRSALRAIDALEGGRFVEVTRETGKRNRYRLTDSAVWGTSDCESRVERTNEENRYQTSDCESRVESGPVTVSHGTSDCESRVLSLQEVSVRITTPPTPQPGEGVHTTSLRETFGQFWAVYPKKRSKGRAEKAWFKLIPSEQLVADIVAAIGRAKTSNDWTKEGGKYIPYPATWLNDRGWEDEPIGFKAASAAGEAAESQPRKRRIIRMKGGAYEYQGGELVPVKDLPQGEGPPIDSGSPSIDIGGIVSGLAGQMSIGG